MRLIEFDSYYAGMNTGNTFKIYINPDQVQCVRLAVDIVSIQLVSGIEYQVVGKLSNVIYELKEG